SDKVLSGDGENQSVTSDAATDMAGNVAAGSMVGGIDIDGHAPQTLSNNTCVQVNGWCTGAAATVALTATDVGPSGVREIRYSVDGGPWQVSPGATKAIAVSLDGSGSGTVDYYAVDRADNAEPVNHTSLTWDNIAPTVTHTVSPTPNAEGWNRADTTVHFTAKDDDKGSGVDPS